MAGVIALADSSASDGMVRGYPVAMTASDTEDRTDVLGRRIGAGLLDLLVVFVLGVLLAMLVGDTEASGGNASFNLEGGGAVLWFALILLYYAVSEATTGQTLGKRLLGIRVVADDGQTKASGRQIAIRTLLRLVDGIAFYAVALAVVLATGERRQRIGDLAAGTVVVAAR